MIDDVNKVCFVHIPKNAGQSVEQWFLDLRELAFDDRAELGLYQNPLRSGLPRANDHMTFRQYQEHVWGGSVPDDMRIFAIVRDPIARLRSELAYRFEGKMAPRPLLALRHVPIERVFGDFRCHLQTQSSFIDGAPKGRIDVLRLENLNTDFSNLMRKYGLPTTSLPHINTAASRRKGQPLPQSIIEWGIETYAEDFERFGYERPTLSQLTAA